MTAPVEIWRGRVLRDLRSSTFRVAIVVETTVPKSPGRVRVCTWVASSRSWTYPQAIDPSGLAPIVSDEISQRHRGVVRAAMANVGERQVLRCGTKVYVELRPALHVNRAPVAAGITKLHSLDLTAIMKAKS